MLLPGLCRAGGCTQYAAHPFFADGHGDDDGDDRAIRNAVPDCRVGANTHWFFPSDLYQDACAHPNADSYQHTHQYAHGVSHRDAGHTERNGPYGHGDPYTCHANCNFDVYAHTDGNDSAAYVNSYAHRERDAAAADCYRDGH